MVALNLYARRVPTPTVWRVPRSGQWWEGVLNSEDGLWWKSNFRMSKDTFLFLCSKLKPFIQKKVRHCTYIVVS